MSDTRIQVGDLRHLDMEPMMTCTRTQHLHGEGSSRRQPQHVEGLQCFDKTSAYGSSMSRLDVHSIHDEKDHRSSNISGDAIDTKAHTRRDLRRRRSRHPCLTQQTIFSLAAAAALLMITPYSITDAAVSPSHATHVLFVPPRSRQTYLAHSNHFMNTQKRSKKDLPVSPISGTTWSNAVRQKSELDESRFGVRNRVKSVLKKAKKRTGIETGTSNNKQSPSVRSGASVVAETASIGAWDVDAAFDIVSKVQDEKNKENKNGATKLLDEMIPSEPKYEDPAILSKLANELISPAKNGVKVGNPSPKMETIETSSTDESPEDDFVLASSVSDSLVEGRRSNTSRRRVTEKDSFTGDVMAAFSFPREPLPFQLPALDTDQYRRLMDGERIQYQDDMGRAGSGFVVWDVKAPASVVWDCLLDFQSYPETIPTVREVVMYTNTHLKEDYRAEKPIDFEDGTSAICKHGVPSVTRAQFALSKFKLKIAALHKYRPHPKGDYMIFTLDPASSNLALKYAKGIWYTESNPDGKEGHTRVWLLCELKVSRLLPQWIVDYAASRAMPRATTWLKPQVEAAAQLWLKDRR